MLTKDVSRLVSLPVLHFSVLSMFEIEIRTRSPRCTSGVWPDAFAAQATNTAIDIRARFPT